MSGGPDSLALLLLAHAAFPGRMAAATIDHGLRADSAAEAAFVGAICAARAIPHHILRPSAPISGSLQASARAARYALLDRWRSEQGIDWLMTAHHADDQLETMVMRLARSSGVGGLAGVRARQGHVLRPLRHVRRAALRILVEDAGITPVDDPSNRDDRFDRARLRKALAGQDFLDAQAASVSADALADADAALDWTTSQMAQTRVIAVQDGLSVDVAGLPHEYVRRLLRRALVQMGEAPPRSDTLERAITAASHAGRAMVGNIFVTGDGMGKITLSPAPPRGGHRHA